MNDYVNILIRSVLEALTEFLPVSSTGHLFLFSNFFPFQSIPGGEDFEDLFDIFIQSGAILSVVYVYYRELLERAKSTLGYLKKESTDKKDFDFYFGIAVGCVPVMILGFLVKDKLNVIKSSSYLLLILSVAWIIGGIIFLLVERLLSSKINEEETAYVTWQKALIIGTFQCIALIPGVSRSAATIITGRFLGLNRRQAAEYSFFLAVPVLIAAGLYKLLKYRDILNLENIVPLMIGFVLSFLFCIVVIRVFLMYIRKHSFEIFGYYRIVLGVSTLIFFYSGMK
ncbi:MAG: undecaprenyl-diphosphatase UppP [Leptospiraceae bacterium]|nr:undecaprenyl-diphosphatase UppP [Leptospiraceae bacterium]MCP5513440.1 undecaprenyl-diphosphatase UppP [Leptospiraceae bacterium]